MKIDQVITSKGLTGFYTDDIRAIRANAPKDGFLYSGQPLTEGFKSIRQAGESVSVTLLMDDGQVCFGDCAGTQYSGSGGREKPFTADTAISWIEDNIVSLLEGREVGRFLDLSREVDALVVKERPIPRSIAYGVTQAILEAVALSRRQTMTEVLLEEYNLAPVLEPVPIYAQTGDDRYTNVDKMIVKRVDILPHALINNVDELVGSDGGKLLQYATWVRDRVRKYGDSDYNPTIHLDVYGTIGVAMGGDLGRVADYLCRLEAAVAPFPLIVEAPIEMESRDSQIDGMKRLRELLHIRSSSAQIMVDEWCNGLDDVRAWAAAQATDVINVKTLVLGSVHNIAETVLHCRDHGIGTLMGGSCNETDKSGQVRAHVALATRPDAIAAVPGMGVDEGLMTVHNEMQRTLALMEARSRREGP